MEYFSKQTDKNPKELYALFQSIVERIKDSKIPFERTRRYSYGLLARQLNIPQEQVEQAYRIFFDAVLANILLIGGAKQFLAFAKSLDIKIGIVTEDDEELALAKFKKFRLIDYVGVLITPKRAGTMKPSATYFLQAQEELRVKPEECLVVGDNYERDLKLPQGMGAMVVLFGNQDSGADYCVYSFTELQALLEKLNRTFKNL